MATQQTCVTPFELVDRIKQNLQRPIENVKLEWFRHTIDQYRYHLDNWLRPDLTYIKILLDDIFLDGTLKFVPVCWDGGKLSSFGYTELWDDGAQAIYVHPVPFTPGQGSREERLFSSSTADSILSTLLHEMTHAFLRSEGCDGTRCKKEECRRIYKKQVGSKEHGDAFNRIAALLQEFVRRHQLWACNMDLWGQVEFYWREDGAMMDEKTIDLCWPADT